MGPFTKKNIETVFRTNSEKCTLDINSQMELESTYANKNQSNSRNEAPNDKQKLKSKTKGKK